MISNTVSNSVKHVETPLHYKNEIASTKRYKIQIAASVNKPIAQKTSMWQEVKDITIKQEENMYKYLTGNFISLEDANREKSKMRNLGFKGAFVVAYEGDDRINL